MLVGGLSPRTRGSQPPCQARSQRQGSIPAHAGEPVTAPFCSAQRRVYPRARGGASRRRAHLPEETGLSPRTRGSQRIPSS